MNHARSSSYQTKNQSPSQKLESARIFWLGAEKKFLKSLATEKYKNNQKFLAVLPNDGKHIYVANSTSWGATISKMKIREKKTLWTVDMPTRVIRMKISPNNKHPRLKLSDSRFGVISDIE